METLGKHLSHGGTQGFYRHDSTEIGLPMRFSVYVPRQAMQGPVPVLFYLAGLTCTEETFPTKAGAQRYAAEHGLMLVAPDTSPRGAGIEGENASWDFGVGAGFYVDATVAPWDANYRMHAYITGELLELVCREFPADRERVGIFGHSMGGHGALVLALRHPDIYRSVSAFAPIAAPSQCPWGHKAFGNYLGADKAAWAQYDASLLMAQAASPFPQGILIDQGLGDQFLAEQLLPHQFEAACRQAKQPLTLRLHEGYDHGYYFIASFIADHIAFHARNLKAG